METLTCHFRSMDAETCMMEQQTKVLPASTKIATLKVLCKKFFKVSVHEQHLTVCRGDGSDKKQLPLTLDDDESNVGRYITATEVMISMCRAYG